MSEIREYQAAGKTAHRRALAALDALIEEAMSLRLRVKRNQAEQGDAQQLPALACEAAEYMAVLGTLRDMSGWLGEIPLLRGQVAGLEEENRRLNHRVSGLLLEQSPATFSGLDGADAEPRSACGSPHPHEPHQISFGVFRCEGL